MNVRILLVGNYIDSQTYRWVCLGRRYSGVLSIRDAWQETFVALACRCV